MDLLKAKINLDKINRAFAQILSDPDNVQTIEIDITRAYVREFYDALHNIHPPSLKPPQVPRAVPAPPAPTPAPTPAPIMAPPAPVFVPEPIAVVTREAQITTPSWASIPPEMEHLFEFKEAKELSEKLSDSPIPDIKKALSLNDRLLIQRELFANDPVIFENVLQQLNTLTGFEAAKSFLCKDCVQQFDWLNKSKVETAKWFIRIVRRRHK